jgi:hypothetical protein
VLLIQAINAEISTGSLSSKEVKSHRATASRHMTAALKKGREMARWRRVGESDTDTEPTAAPGTELTEAQLAAMIAGEAVPWELAFEGDEHGLYMYHGRRLILAKADFSRCQEEMRSILPAEVRRLERWVARARTQVTDVLGCRVIPSGEHLYPKHVHASVELRRWEAYEFWLRRHAAVLRAMDADVEELTSHIQG